MLKIFEKLTRNCFKWQTSLLLKVKLFATKLISFVPAFLFPIFLHYLFELFSHLRWTRSTFLLSLYEIDLVSRAFIFVCLLKIVCFFFVLELKLIDLIRQFFDLSSCFKLKLCALSNQLLINFKFCWLYNLDFFWKFFI